MRALIPELFFLAAIGVSVWVVVRIYISRRPSTPDKCHHRRWSKWKTIREVPVHLYAELDEGKGLPDRVDAQVERECISCGIKQVQTVRGIDSPHYK